MEISSLPTDINKIGAPVSPAVEQEDVSKPQVVEVKANSEAADASLNDKALHQRQAEEEKNRTAMHKLSREELEKVIEEVQKRLDAIGSNLALGLAENKETESIVAQIRDKTSDEIVRQFPSEDILKLRAKLNELVGLLFDKKA